MSTSLRYIRLPRTREAGWTADYERITDYLRAHYAADTALHNRPVVIASDFDATLDHAPIRRIRAMGFTDSADQLNLGFQPTWPAPGSVQRFSIPVPPLVQIDHVMTSPALVVTSFTTFHSGSTDHLGVLARLRRTRCDPWDGRAKGKLRHLSRFERLANRLRPPDLHAQLPRAVSVPEKCLQLCTPPPSPQAILN